MNFNRISSGSEFEDRIGYSRAVDDGQYIHMSGTTGYDYDKMRISEDVVVQAEQCFKNIAHALSQAGCGLDAIVRVRYIFSSRDHVKPCWPVFKKYLGDVKPAATLIIAGLLDDAMKIEIEVTAKK